ncbi:MAG: cation diffusion facilitator family transporter [Candidatus Rokuibacteriota bacterium]
MEAHAHRQTAATRSRGRLTATLALTCGFLVVEVVGALWSGSLALLADAGHMLADAGGLGLALFAIWIAGRPPTPAKTYGYYRAEILAALVNAVVLLAVAAGILLETYRRLLAPPAILGGPMLGIAAVGLVVNLACVGLLHGAAATSLNVRAAYLEVLGDALSSVGVVVAAVMVVLTGWTLADPLVSGAIALVIVPRTWRLLRQAVNVLLEGTPAHLDLGEIETAIGSVAGVRRVHDLHVWTLTSGREAMSAHVVVDDVRDSERLLETLHAVMHARFGIDHTTIQLETEPPAVLRIQGPTSA